MQVILTEEEYNHLVSKKNDTEESKLIAKIQLLEKENSELQRVLSDLFNKVKVANSAEDFGRDMVYIKVALEELPHWIADDIKVRMQMGMIK